MQGTASGEDSVCTVCGQEVCSLLGRGSVQQHVCGQEVCTLLGRGSVQQHVWSRHCTTPGQSVHPVWTGMLWWESTHHTGTCTCTHGGGVSFVHAGLSMQCCEHMC